MKILVIAPHEDDELIGCYDYLRRIGPHNRIDVLYVFAYSGIENFTFSGIKKTKDLHLDIFNNVFYLGVSEYTAKVGNVIDGIRNHGLEREGYDEVLVPHVMDNHLSHRLVNAASKTLFDSSVLRYYHVEMNKAKPLNHLDSSAKKKELFLRYQDEMKGLNSEKYWRFENIEKSDFRKFILVEVEHTYYHKYPEAEGPYAEYLKNHHHHDFTFKVEMEISRNDREVEFLFFRDQVKGLLNGLFPFQENGTCNLSCEDMGEKLMFRLFFLYPNRAIKITVLEDGRNGASLSWGV